MVSDVTLLFHIPMLAASMLVYVVSSITKSSIVNDTLLDQQHLLASRWWLLVDSYFSLISSWLGVLLCGCPSTSRS